MTGFTVVGVVVGVTDDANSSACTSRWPPDHSSSRTQSNPAEVWAAVGGHGYRRATASADLPVAVVPDLGGPMMPVAIWKVALSLPVAPNVQRWSIGSVHETGTRAPATAIEVCGVTLLHSMIQPVP